MQYRPFGNLGYRVSALGFGAMRLPKDDEEASVETIRSALDMGVNFVDTAPGYMDRVSEIYVGKAVRDRRADVYLSTKCPAGEPGADTLRRQLEESLERLDTDYVDFYHLWGLNDDKYESNVLGSGGLLKGALRARDEGLIRHISFSFHDKPEVLVKIIDSGFFESMLVQYNLLDRRNEDAIDRAAERGMGVVVMGPVGGGRLGAPSAAIENMLPGGAVSTPQLALRFVLSHPGVHVALSGMTTRDMVTDNAEVASTAGPLDAGELRRVDASLQELEKLAQLYCTGCAYCLPCPSDVNIPRVFEYMNYHRVYGLTDAAREMYGRLNGEGERGLGASACAECGECEARCPQDIAIVEQLRAARTVLEAGCED